MYRTFKLKMHTTYLSIVNFRIQLTSHEQAGHGRLLLVTSHGYKQVTSHGRLLLQVMFERTFIVQVEL